MKRSFYNLAILLTNMLALAACNMPGIKPSSTPIALTGFCGDDICDGAEDVNSCPIDCQLVGATAEAANEEGIYRVTNPTSGAQLYVRVIRSQIWDGEALPTLVLVPGGNDSSSTFLDPPQNPAQRIADAGFVVVVFDPDGRGQSEGEEDHGGFVHQDGLAAVIQQIVTLPEVDPSHVGLVSYSYGITMASGALARHPDLPVTFLIDWEGPADRNDTGGCDDNHIGHLTGIAECDDEAFWSQREALTFIGQIKASYLRMQSERDHVQPDTTHAMAMIDAAMKGGVPSVRLNDMRANLTFDATTPIAMLSEEMDKDREALVVRYAQELLMGE